MSQVNINIDFELDAPMSDEAFFVMKERLNDSDVVFALLQQLDVPGVNEDTVLWCRGNASESF